MHEVLERAVTCAGSRRGDAEVSDISAQLQEWTDQANRYFGQLNEPEKYGWIAVGVGFLLVVVGGILIFI